MGHNAGWLNVRVDDGAQLVEALGAHMRARGATLIGEGFAATRAPTPRRLAFAVCREPVFCAGSNWVGLYSSHDDGYTPDPAFALELAERLRTVVAVCCVIEAGGAALYGVVGPPALVRAFADEGHSPDCDEMFWNPRGETAFRHLAAQDADELTFLTFETLTPSPAADAAAALSRFFDDRGGDRCLLAYEHDDDSESEAADDDLQPDDEADPDPASGDV